MRDCLTRNPNERREPAGPVARTKRANANFGPRDFPRRSTGRGSRTRTESRHELGERASGEAGERGGEGEEARRSLIIGLNVANADFDESSGFECPLRYVTVTLASQLTN